MHHRGCGEGWAEEGFSSPIDFSSDPKEAPEPKQDEGEEKAEEEETEDQQDEQAGKTDAAARVERKHHRFSRNVRRARSLELA